MFITDIKNPYNKTSRNKIKEILIHEKDLLNICCNKTIKDLLKYFKISYDRIPFHIIKNKSVIKENEVGIVHLNGFCERIKINY